ncbi:aldehyde dehydrogenase family protein [Leucobacter soli]|uniref:Phenylacetaldehyde dehydrogenase n=1 Tax=Leucobacter soli TaxID=2812850 RepID=A0A916NGJ9_9MICO|nr:aldehyde dehydrogenase family protein [Leucobacter soli]CAG7608150.1 Phenylacetaldehyde dehydrogenase [Leucobacter soli]
MTSELPDTLTETARAFIAKQRGAYIDGEIVEGSGGELSTIDPSTGAVIATLRESDAAVVDRAVASAARAYAEEWRDLLPAKREALLHRLADLIEEHAHELSEYDALEGGKPIAYVEAVDLPLAVEQFRYYAGWPTKITGSVVPVSTPGAHVYTQKVPLGVVAAITPWNFPFCQAAIKLAPALAAGNTVVLKPSELTMFSSLRLAELAIEAGLPAGVVNVVVGTGATTGNELVRHPGVRKITFTGSDRTGRLLGSIAGENLIDASLELGGKNPHVIFADADIPKAAAYAATTAFFYSGQVCFSGSRILVERSALDEVVGVLEEHARALVLGAGLSTDTTMGPLSSAQHLEKVEGYLQAAAEGSGSIAFGGKRLPGAGYFLEPTALVGPADDESVVAEEIFGPVVVVQPFDTFEEAIERSNDTRFGLTAGVWTRDAGKAHRFAQSLDAGTVWVNTYADYNAAAPFGGMKDSGNGRDCGPEGLEKYLDTRTIWMSID